MEEKQLEAAVQQTIQARAREGSETAMGLLFWLSNTGDIIAPWWSKTRDQQLRALYPTSNHFSGAMYSLSARLASVPYRIEPRDPSVRSHWVHAEEFHRRLAEGSEFGRGWVEWYTKWLVDRWTQDNGAFAEIIGDGPKDGPIRGPAVGIANMDSWRCTRTGNPEYPVRYLDTDGREYKLHYTRVMYASELPSNVAEMNGIGLCWFSRSIDVALNIRDDMRYKQEKMGSRPMRGILVGRGIGEDVLAQAASMANESADNRGQSRYATMPVVANKQHTEIGIDLVDLASLPDGFSYEDDVTLGMFTIALAGGFPPRWIWPATTTGATKADAMYQHIAGVTSGPGTTLRQTEMLIGGDRGGKRHQAGKFLPPHLRMVFDFQDDEQDSVHADISLKRSQQRERDLANSVIDVRVSRQQALASGDLSDEQFEALELESGRLLDGTDVLALFDAGLNVFLEGLDLDSPTDALVERKRRVDQAGLKANTSRVKSQTRQASAAIDRLLETRTQEPVATITVDEEMPDGEGEAAPSEESPQDEKAVSLWDYQLEHCPQCAQMYLEKQRTPTRGRPSNRMTATNDFTGALRDTFTEWAEEATKKLDEAEDEDRDEVLAAMLALLLSRLKSVARTELQLAFEMGLDGATPDAQALEAFDATLARVDGFLEGTVADVGRRFQQDASVPGFAFTPEFLMPALDALSYRTELYGGWFWSLLAIGAGAAVRRDVGEETEIRRELDPRAKHCNTCPGKEGVYDSWDDMIAQTGGVPGDMSDECGTNCRCKLFANIDGNWVPILT